MFNQNGGSRADTLVKLVLIFFISLLSFSIGTFVGKQFSDTQHKRLANEGEIDEATRDTASVDPKTLDVAPQDALTDEDIANLEDEFVNTKKDNLAKTAEASKNTKKDEPAKGENKDTAKNEATKPADTKTAKADKSGVKETVEAIHAAAQKVAKGEKPVEKATETTNRVPSSMPTRAANDAVGKYTVQVASYNNEREAAKQAKELVNKGFSAFYLPADINGKTWYRVGIGLHGTMAEAKKAREDLVKQPDIKTAIVQKVSGHPNKSQN